MPRLRTSKGWFDPFNLDPFDVHIEDIATALGRKPRWSGFGSRVWTIADHSIAVMKEVQEELQIYALLHDAAEAYLADIPSPIKHCVFLWNQEAATLEQFRAVEARALAAIFEAFNLKVEYARALPDAVHLADQLRTDSEEKALFGLRFSELKRDSKPFLRHFKEAMDRR